MNVESILDRSHFFRNVQLWPTAQELDFENWLDNFETDEDRNLAAQVLKFFIYIPDTLMNQLLKTAVGRCGYYFAKNDPDWVHDDFKNKCWYSFVQGEDKDDITDSGYIFTRKLRDELDIPKDRILNFRQMIEMLEDNAATPQNVVLVDDFVGTGAQTDEAWNKHRFGKFCKTLGEHVASFHHRVVYAPLVVNEMGLNRIKAKCTDLRLEYIYLLTRDYSLLNPDGLCWQGDKARFYQFIDLLRRVADKESIPQMSGNHVNDMLGFGRQGLALAFAHGIPDACPAFFYWKTETWKPLRKRPYHR